MLKNKETSNRNNVIYNVLCFIFLAIFLVFPCMIVMNNTSYLIFSVVLIFLILFFSNKSKIKFLENKKLIFIIVGLTLFIRIIFVMFINSNITQISDFSTVYKNASSFSFEPFYYQKAYHYLLYTYINGLALKLFGTSQIVILLINAFVVSIVPIFLYLICNKLFNNRSIGNIASLIYCVWPSMIIYTSIMSPDHFAMLFLTISVYLLLLVLNDINKGKTTQNWHLLILAGVCISLIGFFKNFAPILLVATFIILFLKCLLDKKLIKLSVIAFLSISLMYLVTNACIFNIEENIIGNNKIMKNQFWQYAYVGLGLENDGLYSQKRYGEFHQYLKDNNMDIKAANKYFSKKLFSEIKGNFSLYPSLLYRKTTYSFAKDDAQLWWVFTSVNETYRGNHIRNILANIIVHINECFYILLILFTITSSIYNVVVKKNEGLLLINIIIFGCCFMLLFVESQGRYKYSFEPLLCIMAACSMLSGGALIKSVLGKGKEQ